MSRFGGHSVGRHMVSVWLGGALLWSGCSYPVLLRSSPSGASVTLVETGEVLGTPAVSTLRFPVMMEIRAPGHRRLHARVQRREVSWLRHIEDPDSPETRVRGVIEFVLVPTHGPAGTWTEEDVGQ